MRSNSTVSDSIHDLWQLEGIIAYLLYLIIMGFMDKVFDYAISM